MKNKSTLLIIGFSFLLSIFGTTAKQGDKSVQGAFTNPTKFSIVYKTEFGVRGPNKMIRTSDGGSLASGQLSTTTVQKITKLTPNGMIEWQREIGLDSGVWIRNLVEIPGDGYEAIGYLYFGDIGMPTCRYVLRLNYSGEVVSNWPPRKGAKNINHGGFNPIVRCTNNTYVTISNYVNLNESSIPYFWRYDADGNLINEIIYDTVMWRSFFVKSLFQTSDGGFGVLLVGDGPKFTGEIQLWRLDSTGKKLWSKELIPWNSYEYTSYSNAIQTSDGGFALVRVNTVAIKDTSHTIIHKFDAEGNTVFQRRYARTLSNFPTSIIETPSGNLLIGGFSQNNNTWKTDKSAFDFFIMKTTSTGDLLYTDSFGDSGSGDCVVDLSAIDDNTFLVFGYTGLTDEGFLSTKSMIIKISDLASAVSEQPAVSDGIYLFPNPTSTQFTLSGVEGVASVRVVNSLGEEVKQFAHVRSEYSIDVSDLVSGLYFVSIRTAKGAVVKPMMVSR
ncbi:MAG: T9SS type A sorting domain-containing protein [Bacteroidetes bacterium]|nr:T9SS type A sorting domain-containing protein [Bacteroidota bacterium]